MKGLSNASGTAIQMLDENGNNITSEYKKMSLRNAWIEESDIPANTSTSIVQSAGMGTVIVHNNELHVISSTGHFKMNSNSEWEKIIETAPTNPTIYTAASYNNEIHVFTTGSGENGHYVINESTNSWELINYSTSNGYRAQLVPTNSLFSFHYNGSGTVNRNEYRDVRILTLNDGRWTSTGIGTTPDILTDSEIVVDGNNNIYMVGTDTNELDSTLLDIVCYKWDGSFDDTNASTTKLTCTEFMRFHSPYSSIGSCAISINNEGNELHFLVHPLADGIYTPDHYVYNSTTGEDPIYLGTASTTGQFIYFNNYHHLFNKINRTNIITDSVITKHYKYGLSLNEYEVR